MLGHIGCGILNSYILHTALLKSLILTSVIVLHIKDHEICMSQLLGITYILNLATFDRLLFGLPYLVH